MDFCVFNRAPIGKQKAEQNLQVSANGTPFSSKIIKKTAAETKLIEDIQYFRSNPLYQSFQGK